MLEYIVQWYIPHPLLFFVRAPATLRATCTCGSKNRQLSVSIAGRNSPNHAIGSIMYISTPVKDLINVIFATKHSAKNTGKSRYCHAVKFSMVMKTCCIRGSIDDAQKKNTPPKKTKKRTFFLYGRGALKSQRSQKRDERKYEKKITQP